MANDFNWTTRRCPYRAHSTIVALSHKIYRADYTTHFQMVATVLRRALAATHNRVLSSIGELYYISLFVEISKCCLRTFIVVDIRAGPNCPPRKIIHDKRNEGRENDWLAYPAGRIFQARINK